MKLIDADKLREQIMSQYPDGFFDEIFRGDSFNKVMALIDEAPDLSLTNVAPTCKFCGFYENNCPFIRGKVCPYPKRVCKDYTPRVLNIQAEENNALTTEDVRDIVAIADLLAGYAEAGIIEPFLSNEEAYYTEILKRFNALQQ